MPKVHTPEDSLPITPSVVAWARERAQYSIEEAQQQFKKIAEWESGSSSPSYPQLEQMSDKFKCPIAVFFFPEPPDVEPIEKSFRTLTKLEFDQIPREIRVLLRKGRAMQLNLAELNGGTNPAIRMITHLEFEVDGSIEEMAAKVREYMRVPLDQQFQWPSIEIALENWREAFASAGIFVFKEPFYMDEYSGFCLFDETFPIIYVNNSTTKTKQIFTLFHELAHLIFHTSGVDALDDSYIDTLPENSQKIEIICNRFAGKLLVPDDSFDEVRGNLPPDRETASILSNRYNVSREVIYRKFLDRDLISMKEYEKAADIWKRQGKREGKGGNYYYNQMAYLGHRYINIAFKQYYQNKIDKVQLAEYLNMKPKNVNTFEETYARVTSG
ncbi:ImmA/IrrE family metallo-endopeptidase [Candidatus Nitrospira allomarina]|uniref:ImmA/IrrE family metallo-endopeptidase n=1 Tax=Candidatus Nitrospira allomarina TaxID=3020900 RepID=A0AA96JZR0_9BACT|nr:ImmA/IrrE family metallo-endopeptidase [Candidatus Nitrospira allomarina]WNM58919.1 ImmA/IrrE family metallo-endopeptidase [Candidatus Nitrospira allomarina]